MIKSEQIPDEVVEVLTMLLLGHSLNDKNVSIASAAVINAWPGIAPFSFYTADGPRDGFILPLTQENNNGSD